MLFNNSVYVCLCVCLSEAYSVPELIRPPLTPHLLSYHFYLILPHLLISRLLHLLLITSSFFLHLSSSPYNLLLISSSIPP